MHTARTTRTTRSRPGLMSRLRARRAHGPHAAPHASGGPGTETVTTTTTTTTKRSGRGRRGVMGTTPARPSAMGTSRTHGVATTPVHHQRRKPSMGDKISGAMLKLRGSLTRRPGQKAAGTRRMHGTDGRLRRRHHI